MAQLIVALIMVVLLPIGLIALFDVMEASNSLLCAVVAFSGFGIMLDSIRSEIKKLREARQAVNTRHCVRCGKDIPLDAKPCAYCGEAAADS